MSGVTFQRAWRSWRTSLVREPSWGLGLLAFREHDGYVQIEAQAGPYMFVLTRRGSG